MKIFSIGILLNLLLTNVSAQSFVYQYDFGEFANASSFHINPAGYLFVTDTGTDEIYKLDTLGTLLKEAGGYGWSEGAFDDPTGIYATTLNVYVCDKNNHRLQSFDKDLNFVSTLYTRESSYEDERFGYPVSCAVSRQGDLFLLDSENNRVIGFDLFGNFLRNFGGYDAGSFQLSKPLVLRTSGYSNIFVLDKNDIIIYDSYGNGITSFPHKGLINDLNIIFNNFSASCDSMVFINNASSNDELKLVQVNLTGFPPMKDIVSTLIFNNKLYVLRRNCIVVFEK
jgi:DNA-binding beta-propeller fold protein YncE